MRRLGLLLSVLTLFSMGCANGATLARNWGYEVALLDPCPEPVHVEPGHEPKATQVVDPFLDHGRLADATGRPSGDRDFD